MNNSIYKIAVCDDSQADIDYIMTHYLMALIELRGTKLFTVDSKLFT